MYYYLENEYLKVEVGDLGARISRLINKKTNNDLILGFDCDEDYLKYRNLYIGAAVGRNSNVIVGSKIKINDIEYKLYNNLGPDQLHGGKDGFSFVRWDVTEKENEIVFMKSFEDGLDGYPGNLDVKITYKLDKNNLIIMFTGISDKDTIFNPTLHTYFNMGKKDLGEIEFKVNTRRCDKVDENNCPTGNEFNTENTPYDFYDYHIVMNQIKNLKNGIDTNYAYETLDYKLLCSIKTDKDKVNIYSKLPDIEVYTSNDLDNVKGKDHNIYPRFAAIAIEPQYFPNSINLDKYYKPIIKANEKVSYKIVYEID